MMHASYARCIHTVNRKWKIFLEILAMIHYVEYASMDVEADVASFT